MTDLSAGIRFEDDDTLLAWGARMSYFLRDRTARYEDAGDRAIYHWGQHEILGGLRLDLRTKFGFNERQNGDHSFRSIEHWAIGDDIARIDLARIKMHVTRQFGSPTQEETLEDCEYGAEWQVDGAVINIAFFEQHCLKLYFTMKQQF